MESKKNVNAGISLSAIKNSKEAIVLRTGNEGVDLLSLGMQAPIEWGIGKSLTTGYTVEAIIQTVRRVLAESREGFILFLMGDQAPQEEILRQVIHTDASVDVWYDDAFTELLQWPEM